MISFDEAFAIVAAAACPFGTETVPLAAAHRRTLAEPVVALVDWPPADVSAMDGYAVRNAELAAGRTAFRVAGESFPAAPFAGEAGPGECVRIFTGATIPGGFDRVIIQEDISRDGDVANVVGQLGPAPHVRPQGSDFRAGDELLAPGRRLDPRALVAAAGADVAEVTVWRKPRLALLGTGDELAAPGEARLRPGSIPESLSVGLAAFAEAWGGEVAARHRLPDEPGIIERAAASALAEAGLVVVTGGASVGDKDFSKGVFEALGLDMLFSKVAIKPGKPVWFGRAQGRLVLGLPGNPTSAMVTARLLLAPLIAGLSGGDPKDALRWRPAPLAEGIGAGGDRETFVRAQWEDGRVRPMRDQDSGAQKVLSDAELLIRQRAAAPALEAGAEVEVVDF